jgi:tyrosyl-tRNA synthetase
MFGKIMSIPDTLLWSWYELLTDVPVGDIASRRRRVEEGSENPRDTKAELARRITADFHGAEAAARAEEDFRRAFSRGEVPEDVETRELPAESASAAKALVALDLASSMREARRKIAEGALKVYEPGSAEPREVRDSEESLASAGPAVLRLGRRFIRVVWTR